MSRLAVDAVRDRVRGLTSPERNILRELAWWHHAETGLTYRSQAELARDCEIEPGNVSRIQARLIEHGVLVVAIPAAGRRATRYRIPAADALLAERQGTGLDDTAELHSTVPGDTAELRSLVASTGLRPAADADAAPYSPAPEARSTVPGARSLVAGTADQEIRAVEERKNAARAALACTPTTADPEAGRLAAAVLPASVEADSTGRRALTDDATPTAEVTPAPVLSRPAAVRPPLPTEPAALRHAPAPRQRSVSRPRRDIPADAPRCAGDWFEDCKAVHGGACGLDRYRHALRMQTEAYALAERGPIPRPADRAAVRRPSVAQRGAHTVEPARRGFVPVGALMLDAPALAGAAR